MVAPRFALEHVAREQHQLAIGVDDLPVLGDDAQAVAVAVEGQAELGVAGLDEADQLGQVLGLARVGVMVGEVAVDFRVELAHGAAERAQDARGGGAGDAVAGIDRHRHRPRQGAVGDDARAVLRQDVHRRRAAAPADDVVGLHPPAQALDLLAMDGAPGEHHLEAVVVLGVVAAGDLDAARAAVPGARRRDVIEHRRRHRAEVDDVEAGRGEAANQGGGEPRAGAAAVAAHRHRALAGSDRFAAEGAAEVLGESLVDRLADDAADVVGLEDRSGDLHWERSIGEVAAIVGRAFRAPRPRGRGAPAQARAGTADNPAGTRP